MPSQQHLRDGPQFFPPRATTRADGHLEVVEAEEFAAIDAHEVRVLGRVGILDLS
jgi:hypothetical protein